MPSFVMSFVPSLHNLGRRMRRPSLTRFHWGGVVLVKLFLLVVLLMGAGETRAHSGGYWINYFKADSIHDAFEKQGKNPEGHGIWQFTVQGVTIRFTGKIEGSIFAPDYDSNIYVFAQGGYRLREIVFEDTEGKSTYRNESLFLQRLTTVGGNDPYGETDYSWHDYSISRDETAGLQDDNNNMKVYSWKAPCDTLIFHTNKKKDSDGKHSQFKFRRFFVNLVRAQGLHFKKSEATCFDYVNFEDLCSDDDRTVYEYLKDKYYHVRSSDESVAVQTGGETIKDKNKITYAKDYSGYNVYCNESGEVTLSFFNDPDYRFAFTKIKEKFKVNRAQLRTSVEWTQKTINEEDVLPLPNLTFPSKYRYRYSLPSGVDQKSLWVSSNTEALVIANGNIKSSGKAASFGSTVHFKAIIPEDEYIAKDSIEITVSVNNLINISKKAEWDRYCSVVNSGNGSIKAVMTADVTEPVSSMVQNSGYSGEFDGGKHTLKVAISGEGNYLAPFRQVGGANIHDLKVTGTITSTGANDQYCAGIVGSCQRGFQIRRCGSDATISNSTTTFTGDRYFSGIVGTLNENASNVDGTMEDCAFTGKMIGKSGKKWSGLVGYTHSIFKIDQCLVGGTFETPESPHAVCGYNQYEFQVSGIFYKQGTYSDTKYTTSVSDFELKGGLAAWMLQNERTDAIWGQTLGKDDLPQLWDTARVYHAYFRPEKDRYYTSRFANYNTTVYGGLPNARGLLQNAFNESHYYTYSFKDFTADTKLTSHIDVITTVNDNEYMSITTKDDWKKFCDYIKAESSKVNARLTKFVELDATSPMAGDADHKYGGTFLGQNNYLEIKYTGTNQGNAPFLWVADATINGLRTHGTINLTSTTLTNQYHASGMVAFANNVTMDNCESDVKMIFKYIDNSNKDRYSGGFVGHAEGGKVKLTNCKFDGGFICNDGAITGVAGLVGWSAKTIDISHCYVGGKYTNVTNIHPFVYTIASDKPTVTGDNNYYNIASGVTETSSYGNGRAATDDELTSGSLTHTLQNGQTPYYWGQSLGEENEPMLENYDHVHKVDFKYGDLVTATRYANTGKTVNKGTPQLLEALGSGRNVHHYYSNLGFKGFDANNTVNSDKVITVTVTEAPYFPVKSFDDLKTFSSLANTGFNSMDAKLENDITFSTPNDSTAWSTINNYSGIFDGQNYCINNFNQGLRVNFTYPLFGGIAKGGEVKDLGIVNPYIFLQRSNLGILTFGNYGTVSRVWISGGSLSHGAQDNMGAIVGINGGTIENCLVKGLAIVNRWGGSNVKTIAGIAAINNQGAVISHCVSYGNSYANVNNTNSSSICAVNNGTITSCYTDKELNLPEGGEVKSNEVFKNGKLLPLLGKEWAIVLGTEPCPMPVVDRRKSEVDYIYNNNDSWYSDNFVMNDTKTFDLGIDFTAKKMTYNRSLKQGLHYTVVLPYAWSKPGDGRVYTFDSFSDPWLNFKEVTDATLQPNVPYIYVANSASEAFKADNAEVKANPSDVSSLQVERNGFVMKPNFKLVNNDEAAGLGAYILQSDKKWYKVRSDEAQYKKATIPAYRAYVVAKSSGAKESYDTFFDSLPTGIGGIRTTDSDGTVRYYDLSGRYIGTSLEGQPHGVYIGNGKKIVK